jgi:hypothetical protein
MTEDANTLIAFEPSGLKAAHTRIAEWTKGKIESLNGELSDLKENFDIAKKSKWRTSALSSAMNRVAKRIAFYDKIQKATEAGYVLIPSFPVNIFAVRTKHNGPLAKSSTWSSRNISNERSEGPRAGEGKYVSPQQIVTKDTTKDEQGKDKTIWLPTDFMDVEFPLTIAKPILLQGAAKAMALNVFDEIGLVGVSPKRDPILVGTVVLKEGYNTRRVNFFISWWLELDNL